MKKTKKKTVEIADFQVGETLIETRAYAGTKHEFTSKVIEITPAFVFAGGKKISRKPVNIGGVDYFFESGNDIKFRKSIPIT